jgi:3-isopropylmalate/(R)-2-methylmalate dehydratase small subunit
VVSARFADIFRGNSLKNGLLPVQLSASDVETLQAAVEQDPHRALTIDLEQRQVRCESIGLAAAFEIDDFTRWRLMEGLDDVGLTLRHEADITEFEANRPSWLPSTV